MQAKALKKNYIVGFFKPIKQWKNKTEKANQKTITVNV